MQLAQQFGHSTGRGMALRSAIGAKVVSGNSAGNADTDGGMQSRTERTFRRYEPDPDALSGVTEPHDRGAILVAAVFDAFLAIYGGRIEDLKRIATGGTGILPQGPVAPRTWSTAWRTKPRRRRNTSCACVSGAMDYVPPVDITFGEFLRALITADADLVPRDERGYRVAFIEAFRQVGHLPARRSHVVGRKSCAGTPRRTVNCRSSRTKRVTLTPPATSRSASVT
jgi:hypothetical protein